ncbi:uridine-cytidine kinase-like 1, partial [Dendropsophus ebraccatus]|uniref:uridine-cytidine kinase-like 1 n=1 Tax=Dendropsophus ebraccatus TaxID=150705 RepID=UPI003831D37A
ITGVSILRAGETMEQALTAVCKDIRLGKILIQPTTIQESQSFITCGCQGDQRGLCHSDGQHCVHRGGCHDGYTCAPGSRCPGGQIFLISLLMAEMGVHSVAYAFPRVRIITTAVDKRVNQEFISSQALVILGPFLWH